MPRSYIRKDNRPPVDEEKVELAVKAVMDQGSSLGKAALKYGLKKATLQHRIEKRKAGIVKVKPRQSKFSSNQVFSQDQEIALAKYITTCSKMLHGLSLKTARKLAYEYACAIPDCRYPSTWNENKIAGEEWMYSFRKRNTNISLRTAEKTSAARAYSFNAHTVNEFFENYESVLKRYNFRPEQIYNFDETGVTTVMNPPKVLADKRQRQVGQITSAERGQLVTLGGAISATGNFIPPVYIFPRAKYNPSFINGAPEGSLGLVSKSGWINSKLFIEVLKHIQRHTRCSKDNHILLIMDNHESHISIEAIEYEREHGIVFLSLHPHTSHKMQPLDVGVFSSFKIKCRTAINDWHLSNPGRTLSIYEIASLTKIAFMESFTAKNITSGFEKTGIWPFNRMIFSEDDFLSSFVTDRENPETQNYHESTAPTQPHPEIQATSSSTSSTIQQAGPSTSKIEQTGHSTSSEAPQPDPATSSRDQQPGPVTSFAAQQAGPTPSSATPQRDLATSANKQPGILTSPLNLEPLISPEHVRPYPKAEKRKTSGKGRKPGKSRIYTDSPEKKRIAEIAQQKREKEARKLRKKVLFLKRSKLRPQPKRRLQ